MVTGHNFKTLSHKLIYFYTQINPYGRNRCDSWKTQCWKINSFNRLVKKREAIVDAVSGVTRDRHYGQSDWNGVEFSLIDTGGYIEGSDGTQKEIDKQVNLAIEEADAILFLVDVVQGLIGMDQTIAQLLRRSKKPVFLIVNKGTILR